MTHLRYLAEFERDDTDEKLCGLEPEPLDVLHQEHLDQLDRAADHAPAKALHWMTSPAAPRSAGLSPTAAAIASLVGGRHGEGPATSSTRSEG
jgi:hypothetical protein